MSLESDDTFGTIKATGDPSAVTKVFQKLEDSMGGAKCGAAGKKQGINQQGAIGLDA